ncbi:hypothetical protein H0H93_009584 [Arthromyces matolae]|nr:hypothetical protein H0H93_009584 [Arthromyces matolae]
MLEKLSINPNVPSTTSPPLPPPNPPIPTNLESALLINALLHTLWPLINPTIFVSFSSIFEDALLGSLQKFIYGVRVADTRQGSEPIRIPDIHHLPPRTTITSNHPSDSDSFNIEVALAYCAPPPTSQTVTVTKTKMPTYS